jgi:hypothetical protein
MEQIIRQQIQVYFVFVERQQLLLYEILQEYNWYEQSACTALGHCSLHYSAQVQCGPL